MAHRTSSEHSAQRRRLVRRSQQEQRVFEVPLHPKSVHYEYATPGPPPRVGMSPVHGKILRFEPGSERNTQLQDAIEKRRSRISDEQSHGMNSRDIGSSARSSRHSLSQDKIPPRGSSSNWDSREADQSRIANLPVRPSKPVHTGQATSSDVPRQSHLQGNELAPEPRALPTGIDQVLHDHKDSIPQPVDKQHQTITEPQSSAILDPHVREQLGLHSGETIDVDRDIASPVVHETIKPHEHHVIHEHITREIHTYDIYTRVLPLVEFEVLPAKHFFRTSTSELVPMTEAELSHLETEVGLVNYTITPTITSTSSKNGLRLADEAFANLRRFTARHIEPHERQGRRWIDEHGVERSEQWHFYKPVILGARFVGDMRTRCQSHA